MPPQAGRQVGCAPENTLASSNTKEILLGVAGHMNSCGMKESAPYVHNLTMQTNVYLCIYVSMYLCM